jgi:ATP-dependent RNA helicase SUPV3L1/SUV3
VVVSTDAIGMGMNLAIHRVLYVESRKFDGVEYRLLKPTEIKQIAGRAGRFGIFDEGIVMAMQDADVIRAGLSARAEPITTAYLGFPEILMNMESSLRRIMTDWSQTETAGFYQKMDVGEILTLHDALATADRVTFGVLDKPTLYRMITCSVNIKNEAMVAQWITYCGEYLRQMELTPPEQCVSQDLRALETEYRCLDLYFQFGRRMKRHYDYEYLTRRRRELEDAIDEQLQKGKRRYAKRCTQCGGILPYGSNQKLCRACFEKMYGVGVLR